MSAFFLKKKILTQILLKLSKKKEQAQQLALLTIKNLSKKEFVEQKQLFSCTTQRTIPSGQSCAGNKITPVG